MHAGEGPPSSSALKALSSGAPLNDSFFYDFLDLFDKERRSPVSFAHRQGERRRALPCSKLSESVPLASQSICALMYTRRLARRPPQCSLATVAVESEVMAR